MASRRFAPQPRRKPAFIADTRPGPILIEIPSTPTPPVTSEAVVPQLTVIPGETTMMNPSAAIAAGSEPFFGGIGRIATGLAGSLIPGGGLIGAGLDLLGGGFGGTDGGMATVPAPTKFKPQIVPSSGCGPGFVLNPNNGVCESIGSPGDVSTGTARGFGRAVMGRYGVALEPAAIPSVRLKCPRGSVLGNDNLCYDHIRKGDRKWIPGTKPLLTGGERNAIRTAGRVASKLARTQKTLKATSRALGKVC